MRFVVPVLSIFAGLYWSIAGVGYGLWVKNGPGGGAFPLVAGILMVVFGALCILKQYRKGSSNTAFDRRSIAPIVAVAGTILISYVVGLIPALGCYMVLWLKLYEHYSWKKSLSIGGGVAVFLFLIFDLWLKVPVPIGIFEKLLYS